VNWCGHALAVGRLCSALVRATLVLVPPTAFTMPHDALICRPVGNTICAGCAGHQRQPAGALGGDARTVHPQVRLGSGKHGCRACPLASKAAACCCLQHAAHPRERALLGSTQLAGLLWCPRHPTSPPSSALAHRCVCPRMCFLQHWRGVRGAEGHLQPPGRSGGARPSRRPAGHAARHRRLAAGALCSLSVASRGWDGTGRLPDLRACSCLWFVCLPRDIMRESSGHTALSDRMHPLIHTPSTQVHEATADLTANMNQEHCACMTYVRDSFGWVLTPYQASRLCA